MPPATDPRSPRIARAALLLLFLGATLGSALDGIHTHFGATQYARPGLFLMAWWTPILFAAAFAVGVLRPLLDRWALRSGSPAPLPRWMHVIVTLSLFVAAYWNSVMPLPWPYVSGMMLATFGLGWLVSDRTPLTLGIAVVAAIGGPAVEALLVSQGAFQHLQDTAFGLPGWLPFLYLNAAIALTTLARFLSAPSPAQ